MAAIVLDSGALIALERGNRAIAAMLYQAAEQSVEVVTSSACVAEVWRDPARQARLARALAGTIEHPLDDPNARRCGCLMGRARRSDIADAAVATLAGNGDTVLTSDPGDIEQLLAARGSAARVLAV